MLPVALSPGFVSVYGAPSVNGISAPTGSLMFGVIAQQSSNMLNYQTEGQSVLFNYKNATPLGYNGATYYLIKESDIILSENEIEPAP